MSFNINNNLAILQEFLYMYRIKNYIYSLIELKLYVLDNIKDKELNDRLICIFFDRSIDIEYEISKIIDELENDY